MPSPAVLADEGVKAVKAGKYNEGIEKLTEALKERPAPLWLLERSKAYLRTGDLDHALHDAERALRVAFDRANRDMMVEAQLRRAITYFRLKKYADADICAFWAIRLCDGARALEDDGQLAKIDVASGDYAVTAKEVADASAPSNENKQKSITAAMGSGDGGSRTKETQCKNQAFSWRIQALAQLEKLPAGAPGRKVTIVEKYPNPPKELPAKKTAEEEVVTPMEVDDDREENTPQKNTPENKAKSEASSKVTWEKLWNQFRTLHAKNDVRSSFYQTDTTLNVDFFVKNVPKDEFKVDAQTDGVILGPIPNTHSRRIHLLLHGRIKPDETKYTVKSMKIELILKKETPGKWPTLRKEKSEIVDNLALAYFPAPSLNEFQNFATSLGYKDPQDLQLKGTIGDQTDWYDDLLEKLRDGLNSEATTVNATPPKATAAAPSTTTTAGPTGIVPQAETASAPTTTTTHSPLSDQTNKSNTDKPKPAAAATTSNGPAYPTSSKKGPTNWDKIDDEDVAGEEEKDVNSFFQSLYKNADPDTRRAMMKSYVESNGTSLSTSWTEAKEKTYETLPPDGSEAKKW